MLLRVDDWPPTAVAAGQDPADPWRWRLPVGLYVPSLDGKSAKVRFQVYPGVQTVADLGPELFQ